MTDASLRPTERLYYDAPLRLDFDATVIAHSAWEGTPAVILDRSAFYPESGGQLADVGALSGVTVRDVQVDERGSVLHLVEEGAALPAVGSAVRGSVDRARRRLHMALHTGQHMLSRALLDVARAETVSSRLGASACSIDVDLAQLDEARAAEAQELVNSIVEDDVTVRQWFPEPEELAGLPLRRRPKVTENVRVVAVGDFDVSPCGGTHCERSAQVGLVEITGIERYKGKIRVTFLAGRSARRELEARSRGIAALGRMFTCGPLDAVNAIEKLRSELQSTRETLGALRGRQAVALAAEMVAEARSRGSDRVVALLENETVETLRSLGQRVTAEPGMVALLGSKTSDGIQVLAARGEGSGFDCGQWLKSAAAASGGRGGGRPDRAEGKLPLTADWQGLTAEKPGQG